MACSLLLAFSPQKMHGCATRYPLSMTDKKQDATKNLDPDEPTQETEKGLTIGVPERDEFFAGLGQASNPEPDVSNPPSI
jgi:hypothetical protein